MALRSYLCGKGLPLDSGGSNRALLMNRVYSFCIYRAVSLFNFTSPRDGLKCSRISVL